MLQHERRVQMPRALLPFADDASAEDALRMILAMEPPAPPAPPPAQAPPPPRDYITERVQVTRELVLAATQAFERTFTVNDVLDLMTGGKAVDADERRRIRSSICGAMEALRERDELIREAEGYGRRQAIWRRADLSRIGTRA